MISWEASWVLTLLAAVPAWWWVRRRQLLREAVTFPPLQLGEVQGRARGGWRSLLALEGLLLGGVLVALAGPVQIQQVELFDEEGIDLALVLDVSASMQAADFPPNRLEALKRLAADMVRRSSGNRFGVYAFAKAVATQAPFTTDTTALVELLDALSFDSINHGRIGGTAIGDALLMATADLLEIREEGRDQVVVLVTDGQSNEGSDPLLAARYIREKGIRLHVIGIGQDKPVKVWVNGEPLLNSQKKQISTRLDDTQLKQIAALAQGTYHRAGSQDVLGRIFDGISRLERKPLQVQGARIERSYRPRVALMLVALLALWLAVDGLWLRRPLR